WIATAALAGAATLVSFSTMFEHARNFTKPQEQIHIIRILFFVPVYAIVSWFAFRFYYKATYYFIIRDMYECLVIVSFYALILQYVGPTPHVINMAFARKLPIYYPFWGHTLERVGFKKIAKFNPATGTFLIRNKILVMQYAVVRPLLSVVALVTEAMNRYCSESMSVKYGHFWYTVINFVSVSACMYGLIIMYFTIKDDIAEQKPLPKFLSIKIVIFLTMLQNVILSFLADHGVLPETTYWTATNMANAAQSSLVILEMLIASIFHIWAFSAAEYKNVNRQHTNAFRALGMAFNPVDIGRELLSGGAHLKQWTTKGGAVSGGVGGVPTAAGKEKGTVAVTVYEEEIVLEDRVESREELLQSTGPSYGTALPK
ncbi:organic solute transporter Ostalpha-domain-containing protein, partial [Chytriomyces sp. MP71]